MHLPRMTGEVILTLLLFAFLQPLDVDDPQLPAADLDDAVGSRRLNSRVTASRCEPMRAAIS